MPIHRSVSSTWRCLSSPAKIQVQSVKFHLFFLGVGGMGSSAIYSCKFNVSQSDGTLWLHVFASHLRASSTLRSGTHTVKWDQQCENIKDESHNSNKKPPVKKERKKKTFLHACSFLPPDRKSRPCFVVVSFFFTLDLLKKGFHRV